MKFITTALVAAVMAASMVAALRDYDSSKWLWKDSNDKFYQPGGYIGNWHNSGTDVKIVQDNDGSHAHLGTDHRLLSLHEVDADMRDWAASSKRRFYYGTIRP